MTAHWITVAPYEAAWFLASCTCGFTGTARVKAATAEDDAQAHGSKSGHQMVIN